MADEVLYEVRDRVGRLVLNRPEKMNAINLAMRERLWDIFSEVNRDPDVWVLLVTGAGKAFCSGHDLKEMGAHGVDAGKTDNLYQIIQEVWKPTIVAINGICLAQGAGIALSCDIRIASEAAQIGWPQVKRGITSVSGPCILSQTIPLNYALELLYTGDPMTAGQALELKLVNQVVPANQLEDATESFVQRILANAPLPMRVIKEVAVKGRSLSFPDRLRFAQLANRAARGSADSKEGLQAFAEKRAPVWQGQ